MQQEIADYHNCHPKLDQAIKLRKKCWVEDPTLDGASPEEVSRYVRNITLCAYSFANRNLAL
jgi:hypothetical protein